MSTIENPSKRPGGRSMAVLTAVKLAVEQLIRENGRERVTIPMIAERAGVQPSSIYRRWGDLPSVINDVATYRLDPDRPIRASGELRGDLTVWAREIIDHYRSPVNAALLRGGAASAGDGQSDCLRNRRAEAGVIVAAAGEGSPFTPDDVINHLVAPIVYRVIFLPATLETALADKLVGELFEGLQAARS